MANAATTLCSTSPDFPESAGRVTSASSAIRGIAFLPQTFGRTVKPRFGLASRGAVLDSLIGSSARDAELGRGGLSWIWTHSKMQ